MLLCVTVNTQEVPQNPAMVRQTRARRVSNEYSVNSSASGTQGDFVDYDELGFHSLSSSRVDSDTDTSDDDTSPGATKRGSRAWSQKEHWLELTISKRLVHQRDES